MVKAIDDAFDHMELCLVLLVEVIFLCEIGFYFTEIRSPQKYQASFNYSLF